MIPRIERRSSARPRKGAKMAPATPISVMPRPTSWNEASNSAATGFWNRPKAYVVRPTAKAWAAKLTATIHQP
jgi:hypothetical protein